MPTIVSCRKCYDDQSAPDTVSELTFRHQNGHRMELRGVLKCVHHDHQWPISIINDIPQEIATQLPVSSSDDLSDRVPVGIVEDLREAERVHFSQCYKSSTVMCRRALQLALEDRLTVTGKTLGPLLADAKDQSPPLLKTQTDAFAQRILTVGNTGAHDKDIVLAPGEVMVIIHDTVVVLNELFPPPSP